MKENEFSAVSRRRWLQTFLYGLGAGLVIHRAGSSAGAADKDPVTNESGPLTVRVSRPFDAETPIREFTSLRTPNARFFVRSHFGPPPTEVLEGRQWKLRVAGAVERSQVFTMKSLREFDPVPITAVLQWSGNGRACHRRMVPGVQ